MDEAGSRARITAFQVRRTEKKLENPKVREYLQVRMAGMAGGLASSLLCTLHSYRIGYISPSPDTHPPRS